MSEPLYRFIPGAGIVSSRTDWSKAATQLLAVCGITTESHQDRAQGTFYLAKGGDWLASTAKAFSHSGLRGDCWDHNCLSVNGKPQTWTQDQCQYLRQEDTAQYTHLQMSLSGAYQGLLSAYARELFWLKSNLLVIRDMFTPVDPAAIVTFNLNVLDQPVVDLTGFVVVADGGNKLFGTASDWPFTSAAVPLEPNQTRPSYRLTLTGAGALRYCVGLEIAAVAQGQRSVTPYASTALQGMVCGSNLVAAVTLPVPPSLTYTSPAGSMHYLFGLKPNTVYNGPGGPLTSSPAGVLSFTGNAVGQPVTITEGSAPPPPPPVKGRTWTLFVPNDGSPATFSEVPPAAREGK